MVIGFFGSDVVNFLVVTEAGRLENVVSLLSSDSCVPPAVGMVVVVCSDNYIKRFFIHVY